jgi:uncharacterized Zn ribbon protein
MIQYIDKAVIVAEIERMKKDEVNYDDNGDFASYADFNHYSTLNAIQEHIESIEVKDVSTWHLQEKEDIYDAVKDWSLHTFACVMKDGTIQKFTGILDEDCEGHISVNIDGVNDDYDNVDDIVKWAELT